MTKNELNIAKNYYDTAIFTNADEAEKFAGKVQELVEVTSGDLFWALVEIREIADNTARYFHALTAERKTELYEIIEAGELRLEKLLAA